MLLLHSKWRGSDPFLMIRDFPFLCGRFEVLTPYRFSWGEEKNPQNFPRCLSLVSPKQCVGKFSVLVKDMKCHAHIFPSFSF